MDQSASLLRKEPPTVTRTGSFALTWNLLSARALAVNEDERCSLALAAADSNGRGRFESEYQDTTKTTKVRKVSTTPRQLSKLDLVRESPALGKTSPRPLPFIRRYDLVQP